MTQFLIRRRPGAWLFRYEVCIAGGTVCQPAITLWGARWYLRRWKANVDALDAPGGPVVYREGAS